MLGSVYDLKIHPYDEGRVDSTTYVYILIELVAA